MLREIEEINLKEKEHISLKVARKASWNSQLHFGEWVDRSWIGRYGEMG